MSKEITLSQAEAEKVVSYLQSLSDILTQRHQDSHSGTEQFMLISAVQEVDLLAVDIRGQLPVEEPMEVFMIDG